MTIRNDTYTMYKGKEYRILYHDGMAKLVSKNVEDLEKGFVEKIYDTKHLKYTPEDLAEKIYTLIVSPEEIGDVYSIETYVIYQGFEFSIWEEDEDTYTLFSSQRIYVDKLDFKMLEPGIYLKKVKKEELDLIYEKKTLRPNFFK